MKKYFTLLLSLLLSIQMTFASIASISKVFTIALKGGEPAIAFRDVYSVSKENIVNSLHALGITRVDNHDDLIVKLKNIEIPSDNADAIKTHQELLQEMENKDLSASVNKLVILAGMLDPGSKYLKLSCDVNSCSAPDLKNAGIEQTLLKIEGTHLEQVFQKFPALRKVLKSNSFDRKALEKWISRGIQEAKFGSAKDYDFRSLNDEQLQKFALFLASSRPSIYKGLSAEKKGYIEAVRNVSTLPDGNRVLIIDPENFHVLWEELANPNATDDYFRKMTDVINDTAASCKNTRSKEGCFYRVLRKKAGDDEELNSIVDQMKKKNCFWGGR